MPPIQTAHLASYSIEQTLQLGHRLGTLLTSGDVICLKGDLGAGKTAFTKGIGQGWGVLEAVTSPTFTFIHEHRRQETQVFYHVDCYRLQSDADACSIGLDDLLYDDGIVVIEWPERIEGLLPSNRLWITFTITGDTERGIDVRASGEHYRSILKNWLQSDGTAPGT